jgi:hypothetical protein
MYRTQGGLPISSTSHAHHGIVSVPPPGGQTRKQAPFHQNFQQTIAQQQAQDQIQVGAKASTITAVLPVTSMATMVTALTVTAATTMVTATTVAIVPSDDFCNINNLVEDLELVNIKHNLKESAKAIAVLTASCITEVMPEEAAKATRSSTEHANVQMGRAVANIAASVTHNSSRVDDIIENQAHQTFNQRLLIDRFKKLTDGNAIEFRK